MEIIIRAKDGATPALNSIGKAANNAKGGLNGLADALKSGRKTGFGEVFEQLGKYAKGGAALAIVNEAINKYVEYQTAFQEGFKKTGDSGIARQFANEEVLLNSIFTRSLFNITAYFAGYRSIKERMTASDDTVNRKLAVLGSSEQLRNLNLAVGASAPGASDKDKFIASGKAKESQALLPLLKEQVDLTVDLEETENELTAIYSHRANAQYSQQKELEDKKKDLERLLGENKGRIKATGDLTDNELAEFNSKDALRQQDATLQSQMRINRLIGDARRQGLIDYKLTLDAELDLIKDQTTEKLQIIKAAMVKEKEGKSDSEKSLIEKRAGEEMAAARSLADAGKASARRRFEISEEQRKVDLATEFHSIQIDGLQRQADLGDNLAKIEADRLKITDETAAKRLKYQAILRDGKSSLSDQLKAGAALSYLDADEQRRKVLAGQQGVYQGSLASASTSYFSSGARENTLETIIVNPLLLEQRAANELLKQTLDKIDSITSALAPFLGKFGASSP